MNRLTFSVHRYFRFGPVLFFALAPRPALGQFRCDLESALQNNAATCLDVEQLNGKTVNLPANVTRIDYDGLSVCAPRISGPAQPVDVVFLVDLSSSMNNSDPRFYAPTATSNTIQLLFDLSPNSSAGYAGFADGVCDGQGESDIDLLSPPQPLSESGNLAELKALATSYTDDDYGCGNIDGTNYFKALNQAKEFLENPEYSKNAKKAIVFVSDGDPTSQRDLYEQTYANVADPDLPPVFSIFIGKNGGLVLQNLSNKTDGFFYPVASGDTAALEQAMAGMIAWVVGRQALTSTVVSNQTNGQTAQAVEAGHEHRGLGSNHVTLDEVVGLAEGPNTVAIQITGKNPGTGAPEIPKTATFTLNVAAPASTQKGQSNVDGDFGIRCYNPSRLTATNDAGQEIQGLGVREGDFGINLETAPSIVGDAAATASALLSGDVESVGLAQTGSDSTRKGFSGLAAFSLTGGEGQDGSNVLEAQPRDTVTVAWAHPRDARDQALLKLAVTADFRNAGIREVYFDDPDADGRIDRLVLVLDPANPPNLEAIRANPTLVQIPPDLSLDSITEGELPNTLILNVKPNQYVPKGTETLVVKAPPMQLVDGYLQPGAYPIADRMAPVVHAATLIPYFPVTGRQQGSDTLRVVFSKPAVPVNNSDRPFELQSKQGIVYTFVLTPIRTSGDTTYFQVQSVEGVLLPEDKDSLWIKPGHVADLAGNVQANLHNKRVLLEVIPLPEFKAVEALAPLAPSPVLTAMYPQATFPDHWAVVRAGNITPQTFVNSSHRIFLVEPANSPAEPDSSLGIRLEASRPFTAEVFVYSHFGQYMNQVKFSLSQQEFLQLAASEEGGKRELLLKWDGIAEDGSRAGTGVYIFNARLTLRAQGKHQASTVTTRVRVGVFRPQ